jgi:hypothetical protein
MNPGYSVALNSRGAVLSEGLWLKDKTWDLTWISLSASLVVLPFLAYEFFRFLLQFDSVRSTFHIEIADVADVARNTVNGLIALLIGGPHMYATFTRTFLDTDFRKRHVTFLAGSLVIPIFVILTAIHYFQFLITFFFFWASVHVLHQIAYIIDCYNKKSSKVLSFQYRVLDYVVTFSSLYPIGVWRMVNGNFKIGQIELLFPDFLKIEHNPILGWGVFSTVCLIFFGSLTLWLMRTYREYQQGELHVPKTILMGLTIVVAFFIPAYHELDVAFQGFNTWHSFQYLGLTLYINRLRAKKHDIHTPFIKKISEEGKGWRYYAFNVACAFGAVLTIAVLLLNQQTFGLSFDQCYYVVVLSFLLVHYYHDHLLFTNTEAILD